MVLLSPVRGGTTGASFFAGGSFLSCATAKPAKTSAATNVSDLMVVPGMGRGRDTAADDSTTRMRRRERNRRRHVHPGFAGRWSPRSKRKPHHIQSRITRAVSHGYSRLNAAE